MLISLLSGREGLESSQSFPSPQSCEPCLKIASDGKIADSRSGPDHRMQAHEDSTDRVEYLNKANARLEINEKI